MGQEEAARRERSRQQRDHGLAPADRSLGGQVLKIMRRTHADLLLAPVDDILLVDSNDTAITGDL